MTADKLEALGDEIYRLFESGVSLEDIESTVQDKLYAIRETNEAYDLLDAIRKDWGD